MREQGAPGKLSSNFVAGMDCIPADSVPTLENGKTFKTAAWADSTFIALEAKAKLINLSFSSGKVL
jgi:hypothetical protein